MRRSVFAPCAVKFITGSAHCVTKRLTVIRCFCAREYVIFRSLMVAENLNRKKQWSKNTTYPNISIAPMAMGEHWILLGYGLFSVLNHTFFMQTPHYVVQSASSESKPIGQTKTLLLPKPKLEFYTLLAKEQAPALSAPLDTSKSSPVKPVIPSSKK